MTARSRVQQLGGDRTVTDDTLRERGVHREMISTADLAFEVHDLPASPLLRARLSASGLACCAAGGVDGELAPQHGRQLRGRPRAPAGAAAGP